MTSSNTESNNTSPIYNKAKQKRRIKKIKVTGNNKTIDSQKFILLSVENLSYQVLLFMTLLNKNHTDDWALL